MVVFDLGYFIWEKCYTFHTAFQSDEGQLLVYIFAFHNLNKSTFIVTLMCYFSWERNWKPNSIFWATHAQMI